MRLTDKYCFFWNGPLSQWYYSKFKIDELQFNCCEQWMMYSKAKFFGDYGAMDDIMNTSDPKTQKAIGRKVIGFDERRWNEVKLSLVYRGNIAKFSQNPTLLNQLLDTGSRVLVEASPYDKVWGVGLGEDNPLIDKPENWQGFNLLGFCLMGVREELKSLQTPSQEENRKEDLKRTYWI